MACLRFREWRLAHGVTTFGIVPGLSLRSAEGKPSSPQSGGSRQHSKRSTLFQLHEFLSTLNLERGPRLIRLEGGVGKRGGGNSIRPGIVQGGDHGGGV